MKGTNPAVDRFLRSSKQWRQEFGALRKIVLGCDLTEALKWGKPCYTVNGKNVVLIHGFKEYCALLFVKGALLADTKNILIRQTENVQSARQARFTDVEEISKLAPTLKAYIREAIAVEKGGLEVKKKGTAEFAVAEEFQSRLDAVPGLKSAFEALTPGRQRAYLLHFSGAKQSRTRASRVEHHIPRILVGKGLNDR